MTVALPLTFRCAPMNAKLTKVACAGNYRMANHAPAKVNNGPHPARLSGRAHCIECPTGKAHASGVDVPIERVTVKRVEASAAAPPPVTVVPRVDGLLDDKRAKPTAATPWTRENSERVSQSDARARARARDIAPARETFDRVFDDDVAPLPEPTAPPTPTDPEETRPMRTARTNEDREAIVADVLKKELTIGAYADKHQVDQATIRWWLDARVHDPKTWPKGSSGPRPAEPRQSAPRAMKSLTERAEIVARALERKLSIEMYAKAENVGPAALRSWIVTAGHNPLDWPTNSQAHAAALARSRAAIEEEEASKKATTARAKVAPPTTDDEPSIGDVVPELPPRAMDHTELALEEPAPAPEPTPPSPFFNDAPASDTAGDDDFPPFPDEAVDTPIPFKHALVNSDPVRALMGVALVVPVRIGTLIAQLNVSAHVAHVIQSVYMAGLAQGRDMLDETVFWTEHAAEHARRVELTRGAA